MGLRVMGASFRAGGQGRPLSRDGLWSETWRRRRKSWAKSRDLGRRNSIQHWLGTSYSIIIPFYWCWDWGLEKLNETSKWGRSPEARESWALSRNLLEIWVLEWSEEAGNDPQLGLCFLISRSFPGQEYRSTKLKLVWEMSSWSWGWWWGFGCQVLKKKKKKSPSPWRKKEKTELLPSQNPGRLWKNQPEGPAHPGQGPPTRTRCCPLFPAASLEECSADCSHTSLSASVSHL